MNLKPKECTADAFAHWHDPGFPHDILALHKRYFKVVSRETWRKFKLAVDVYETSRANGRTEDEALSDAKLKYSYICLKKLRKWKPTKNLQSTHVGKHPSDM